MPPFCSVAVICRRCGRNFAVQPGLLRKGRGKYCGNRCKGLARTGNIHERFWANVRKDEGCWIWIGTTLRGKRPYGILSIKNKPHLAHRLSYTLNVPGPIPPGLLVLHRCDNPPCVNPLHLFLGTHQDNADDCVSKKRQTRGEKNRHAKLTWEAVREIRREYATGSTSQRLLGQQFGVTRHLISRIVNKHIWRE